MSRSREQTDELLAMVRDRFSAAKLDVSSNEHETYWVEMWTDTGHAMIVIHSTGIGGTDYCKELGPNVSPFAPYEFELPSIPAAFKFLTEALL